MSTRRPLAQIAPSRRRADLGRYLLAGLGGAAIALMATTGEASRDGEAVLVAAAMTEAPRLPDAAPSPAIANPLMAWPCLDDPGCGEDEAPARIVATQAETEAEVAEIPVPAALGLFGFALAALAFAVRRRGAA